MHEVPDELQDVLQREAPQLLALASMAELAPARELDSELEALARDARAFLGHERLLDPPLSWLARTRDGEPAVQAKLAVGRVAFRRWEARLELVRRPVGDAHAALVRALAKLIGRAVEREPAERLAHGSGLDECALAIWTGEAARAIGGRRFERVVAVLAARTLLVALEPALAARRDPVSERDLVADATRGHRPPPPPTAAPGPLLLPTGGRHPRRRRPSRKKAAR